MRRRQVSRVSFSVSFLSSGLFLVKRLFSADASPNPVPSRRSVFCPQFVQRKVYPCPIGVGIWGRRGDKGLCGSVAFTFPRVRLFPEGDVSALRFVSVSGHLHLRCICRLLDLLPVPGR